MSKSPSLGRSFVERHAPRDTIPAAEVEAGLTWVLRNGASGKIMNTLAVGAFLTAFALELGASNLVIGILAAIPQLGNAGQILGVYLTERFRMRRVLCIGFGLIVRPMFLIIAAAALLPNTGLALGMVVTALAVRSLLGSVILSGWNSWLRDLLPEERRAGFLARNLQVMTFFAMVVSLAAAAFIDSWGKWAPGPDKFAYAAVFVAAFVVGAFNTFTLTRIPEPRMPREEEKFDLIRVLKRPFADLDFRRAMAFFASWNFAINLATPFFTVHMLKRLDLDMLTIIVLAVLSQTANMLLIGQWARIIERFSNKAVLSVCAPLFLICVAAWTFTTSPERHAFTIALLVVIHACTGVATAGVAVASANLTMHLAPRGQATAYLSANGVVNSIAAGLAPVIGGLLADFFLSRRFSILLRWESPDAYFSLETLRIEQWDFFFVFAAVIGLYSLHRLNMIEDTGRTLEKSVLAEFMQPAWEGIRGLSSVAGLRVLTGFPLELLRAKRKKRRPSPPSGSRPRAPRDRGR